MSYTYTNADKRALEWCNEVRAKMGKKPVRMIRKGVPMGTRSGALSRTIGRVRLGIWTGTNLATGRQFSVPTDAIDWLVDFDDGKLPHFIAGETHA